jgi:hypothetical protein
MKYCSLTDVKNYLIKDVEQWYEPTIEGYITSISLFINKMTNRTLVLDDSLVSGETKYYDGNGRDALLIDDCLSITKVELGDQYGDNLNEITTTGYFCYPRVPPFQQLLLKTGVFTPGVQNIAITGEFGLSDTVPEDLKFACIVLVAGIIINQTMPTQAKVSESIGSYSVSYRSDKEFTDYQRAMDIINSYIRYQI